MAEKIWCAHKGADEKKIKYAENQLDFVFPDDFKKLYEKSDGFGVDVGYSHVHFWSIDSILAANEIFCEIEKGRYVFFADADDSIDSFAYDKATDRIWVFSTESGIDEGREIAGSIDEMIKYIREL